MTIPAIGNAPNIPIAPIDWRVATVPPAATPPPAAMASAAIIVAAVEPAIIPQELKPIAWTVPTARGTAPTAAAEVHPTTTAVSILFLLLLLSGIFVRCNIRINRVHFCLGYVVRFSA